MSSAPVLICVDNSAGTQKLITTGAEYAREKNAPLMFLQITQAAKDYESEKTRNKILALASLLDADIVKHDSDDVTQGIIDYLHMHPVTAVFLGRSSSQRWRHWFQSDISTQVRLNTEQVDIHVVDMAPLHAGTSWFNLFVEYMISIFAVMLLTGLLYLMQSFIAEADVMMAYLAVVVVLAYAFNRGPTLFAAIASVAAFDFFFVPPFYTFAVDHNKYLLSFAVMAVVGFMFSTFSERMKQQLRETSTREKQLRELYHLARSLTAASGNEAVIKQACFHLAAISDGQASFFRLSGDTIEAVDKESSINPEQLSQEQLQSCHHVQEEQSQRVNNVECRYYPMGPMSRLVLVICTDHRLDDEQHHLLQTYLSLIKLAITRTQLSEQAAEARLQAESEQLRNAILSAVSHDLRTPLGTIMGLVSTILDKDAVLDEALTRECLDTIYNLSEQLSQKVTNLLQMSRNLRGKLKPKIELQNPEEFIGGVLARMKHRLENYTVDIDLDNTLLVQMDVSLMEVVLSNLLDNAAKFSPERSTIKISGRHGNQHYVLSVEDQGMGLRGSDDRQLFDQFYRVHQDVGGTGLGLAISKAIVEAHEGHISAQNAPLKGAVFSLEIPYKDDQIDKGFL